MKVSGAQYYGLLTGGMLFGIVLSTAVIPFFEEIRGSWALMLVVLLAALPAQIAYLTVLLEMWEELGIKVLLVALTLVLGGIFLNPLLMLVLIIGPFVYSLIIANVWQPQYSE